MARVGVFVCHCGTNIAKTVDVEAVAQAALKLPNVVYAAEYKYMCSEPGQQMIREAIAEHKLDRLVVAACSPHLHERTFRACAEQAGLNPYLVEIANIREQCSWSHHDRVEATARAYEQVSMAVARSYYDAPLSQNQLPVERRALVVGGGIAGIQAALDIADAGYEVWLVERTPSIGGRMAQFDKTFPTLDCSACILTPKMVDCAKHPNIKMLTYSEVEELNGFVGNFEARIRIRSRSVVASECKGCGACWEKCPAKKIPSEFNAGMSTRTAIYVPFPQAVPNVPVIDRDNCIYFKTGKCGACKKNCPADCIDFDLEDEVVTERFGAVVLATGFDMFDQAGYGEYGAGQYPNVITGLELERLLNASGPTGGHLERPSDGQEPKTIVFIQCVGSRDEEKGHEYCSRVCCMYTAKHATLIKDKMPNTEVYVFYIDLRATGKGYEEFIMRAQRDYGVKYLRGRVSRLYPEGERIKVCGADTLAGEQIQIDADLVVLASAAEPRADAREVARMIGIGVDKDGFFAEAHPKLRPVENLTAGIYLAGACQFIKDIPDSVASASAAASKVCGLFAKEFLLSEAQVAAVNPEICRGCLQCVAICPFSAIDEGTWRDPIHRTDKKVAQVNPNVCMGCGTCAAGCFASAITLAGFRDEHIYEELTTALTTDAFEALSAGSEGGE